MVALLLAASPSIGLEPEERNARFAFSHVALESLGVWVGRAVLVDAAEGLLLAPTYLVPVVAQLRVLAPDGSKLPATLLKREYDLGLVLLQAGDLTKAGARSIELAPATMYGDDATALSAFAVRLVPSENRLEVEKCPVRSLRGLPPPELRGLVLAEIDAPLGRAIDGAPLVDGEGRLLGIQCPRWDLLPNPEGRCFAIPINAIRRMLVMHAPGASDVLPDGAVLRDGHAVAPPPPPGAPAPPSDEDLRSSLAELRFGPYVHMLKSTEEAALVKRAAQMFRTLRDVNSRCYKCGGKGIVTVVIREGYRPPGGFYVMPVTRQETCPRCNGEMIYFDADVAKRAFEQILAPGDWKHPRLEAGWNEWVTSLHEGRKSYAGITARRATVRGTSGEVRSSPFGWRLVREGERHLWCIHMPSMHGDRYPGSLVPPTTGVLTDFPAGDIFVLADGTIVRLCGIAIPEQGPRLGKPEARVPNLQVRNLVRAELPGKSVGFSVDKYSSCDLDGHPLVYVQVDGKDYGEDLLQRGIARQHPQHRHQRWPAYHKAESAARAAKIGIWAP